MPSLSPTDSTRFSPEEDLKLEPRAHQTLWQRLEALITGYDFFISYRWADGRTYAAALARQIKSRNYDVFLDNGSHRSIDEDGAYNPGDNLTIMGALALSRTTRLVFVGSPEAVNPTVPKNPDYVIQELEIFRRKRGNVIPIDFEGTLSQTALAGTRIGALIPDILRVNETRDRLASGPSAEAVESIVAAFKAERRSVVRLRRIRLVAFFLAVLAIIASGLAWYANQQKNEAIRAAGVSDAQAMAAYALSNLRNEPALAVCLAVEAVRSLNTLPRAYRQDDHQLTTISNAFFDILFAPGGRALFQDDQLLGVTFSPDGTALIGFGKDGTVVVWRNFAGAYPPARQILRTDGYTIADGCVTSDGRWLIAGTEGGRVFLWQFDGTGEIPEPLVLNGNGHEILSLAVSPDTMWVASGNQDNLVRVWSRSSVRPSSSRLAHDAPVYSVAFDATSSRLMTATENGMVRVWTLREGRVEPKSEELGERGRYVAFAPAGNWAAATGYDGKLHLWRPDGNPPASDPIVLNGSSRGANGFAFSRDGRLLALGTSDGLVRVWRLSRDAPSLEAEFAGNGDPVVAVEFSADGKWLAAAHSTVGIGPGTALKPKLFRSRLNSDNFVRYWRLGSGGTEIVQGHELPVTALAASASGGWMASASLDGSVRIVTVDGFIPTMDDSPAPEMHLSRGWGEMDGKGMLRAQSRTWVEDYAARVAGRNMRSNEWVRFMADKPRRGTFPTFDELPAHPMKP